MLLSAFVFWLLSKQLTMGRFGWFSCLQSAGQKSEGNNWLRRHDRLRNDWKFWRYIPNSNGQARRDRRSWNCWGSISRSTGQDTRQGWKHGPKRNYRRALYEGILCFQRVWKILMNLNIQLNNFKIHKRRGKNKRIFHWRWVFQNWRFSDVTRGWNDQVNLF